VRIKLEGGRYLKEGGGKVRLSVEKKNGYGRKGRSGTVAEEQTRAKKENDEQGDVQPSQVVVYYPNEGRKKLRGEAVTTGRSPTRKKVFWGGRDLSGGGVSER